MSVSVPGNRNLLFGVLACELKYLEQSELIAAARHIADDVPFGEFLLERDLIEAETFQFIEALVEYYIAQNGDASQSIHAIQPDPELCNQVMAAIEGETDNQTTFARQIASRTLNAYQVDSIGKPTLEKRFTILRPHAKGGLGEVLVAHDSELNREVALKRIQSWHADQADSRNRFVVEAEITGALEHPGIVPIYGMGTMDDGRPFYAMRYIEGQSLKDAIEQHYGKRPHSPADVSPVAFRKLLSAFIDACNTVAFAHSRRVLHRDLKPANIVLGQYGETHVVDWGLAKILDGQQLESSDEPPLRVSSGSSVAPTQVGSTIGTPVYMSPEQACGNSAKLDFRSDIYSLGATLYTILTGEMPFEKNSHTLEKVQEGTFNSPTQVRKSVPRPLESICLKAMSRSPEERYDSATELAEDVERWLADENVKAHQDSFSEKFNRLYRRNRTSFLVAGGLLLLSLCGLLISNNATRKANENLKEQVQLFERLSRENSVMAFEAVDGAISFEDQGKVVANVVKIFRAYFEDNKASVEARKNLSNALRIRGIQYKVMGQVADSIRCHEEAISLLESIAADEPSKELEFDILRTRNELASTLQQQNLHESRSVLEQCIATLNRLADESPGDHDIHMTLARSYENEANVYLELAEYDAAAASASKAMELFKSLVSNDNVKPLMLYLRVSEKRARAHQFNGKLQKAEVCLTEPLRVSEEQRNDEENSTELNNCINLVLFRHALIGLELDPESESETLRLDNVLEDWRKLAERNPAVAYYKRNYACALIRRASMNLDSDLQAAEADLGHAESILKKLLSRGITAVTYRALIVDCLLARSLVESRKGNDEKARQLQQQGTAIQKQICDDLPEFVRQSQRLEALEKQSDLPPSL